MLRRHDDDPTAEASRVVPTRPAEPDNGPLVGAAYEAHYRDVFRYVLALTGSTSDAEEITADVFERALRSWTETPAHVQAWLLLTARRIATDRFRRARRLLAIRNRWSTRNPVSPEAAEFWLWFDAVSRVLTGRQREALVLRYQRDLSEADIGLILGLSESGVRSLISRALKVLREHPEIL